MKFHECWNFDLNFEVFCLTVTLKVTFEIEMNFEQLTLNFDLVPGGWGAHPGHQASRPRVGFYPDTSDFRSATLQLFNFKGRPFRASSKE